MPGIILIPVFSIALLSVFLYGFLKLFGGRLDFRDALLAALFSSLLSLIPTYGPGISVIGILIVVFWRGDGMSIPMVLFSSLLARISAGLIIYKLVVPDA